MTGTVCPLLPRVLPLPAAAYKLWEIRYLLRAGGALDPLATQTSLDVLALHPNARIAALASDTACDLADRVCRRLEERLQ